MKNRYLLFLILVAMLPLGAFGTLSHDSAGRLEWETAASDSCTAVIRYTYDAAGRLSKTEKGLRKGDSGTEISGSSVTRDYTYDVHGWKVKTVTGISMKLAWGATETTDISTPYYGAASSDVIRTPGGVVVARTKYTETIHYADGAVPRYNGTPSARDLTQGGRYDYRYDALDRLVAADYTPPSGKPDTDFSTEYTYDILSRPTSIKRHGVVDVDGTDEVFGLLDNLTLTYDGATLSTVKSIITGLPGRDYDFGPRGYRATTTLWDSWDIHAADYAMWSPWMYCGGNPIRFVDPTGKKWDDPKQAEKLKKNIEKKYLQPKIKFQNKIKKWRKIRQAAMIIPNKKTRLQI